MHECAERVTFAAGVVGQVLVVRG